MTITSKEEARAFIRRNRKMSDKYIPSMHLRCFPCNGGNPSLATYFYGNEISKRFETKQWWHDHEDFTKGEWRAIEQSDSAVPPNT